MEKGAPRGLVVAAFLAVYLIWGSTYLGIRFAIETLPPFLMAGSRWILAGALLYAWRRAKGDPAPTARNWRAAAIVGVLLIVGGNGLVSWAQQSVPSGFTALLIAVVPMWIALLEWARTRMTPTARVGAGVLLGLAGVALLVGPAALGRLDDAGPGFVLGALLILIASFSWANGSLWSRRAPLPKSTLLGASMQMLAGGVVLTLAGLGAGETARLDLAAVTLRSWLAYGFLVLFGSIVAYSAYVWLLQVTRPELVATYAFVNPMVAVVLGALLAGETLEPVTLAAAALIVVAVAVVVTAPRPPADTTKPGRDVGGPMKEFVLDTSRGLVHRRSRVTPACALDAIPAGALQERETELDATMVMKTRHYMPCPHCYGG